VLTENERSAFMSGSTKSFDQRGVLEQWFHSRGTPECEDCLVSRQSELRAALDELAARQRQEQQKVVDSNARAESALPALLAKLRGQPQVKLRTSSGRMKGYLLHAYEHQEFDDGYQRGSRCTVSLYLGEDARLYQTKYALTMFGTADCGSPLPASLPGLPGLRDALNRYGLL